MSGTAKLGVRHTRLRELWVAWWVEHRQRPAILLLTLLSKEPLVQMSGISFLLTDWAQVERTEHKGETGSAYWQTRNFGDVRIRIVEYTPGYLAITGAARGMCCYASKASSIPN